MRRWPLVASFLLFLLLCASIAYWGMQLFKPPLRPVAAPPQAVAEVHPEAGAALFGGRRGATAVASNYQLRGVILSGTARDSIAILSADGKPAQAVRVDGEVLPGVLVKEVHRDHVLLSDGGAIKRVELPEDAKNQVSVATTSPLPRTPVPMPAPATTVVNAPPAAAPGMPQTVTGTAVPASGAIQNQVTNQTPSTASAAAPATQQQAGTSATPAPTTAPNPPPSPTPRGSQNTPSGAVIGR